MQVVVIEKTRYTQKITNTNKIRTQFVHHFVLGTRVGEIQLTTENRRKDVELLGHFVVSGTSGTTPRRRGAADGSQARRDSLEIQLDAVPVLWWVFLLFWKHSRIYNTLFFIYYLNDKYEKHYAIYKTRVVDDCGKWLECSGPVLNMYNHIVNEEILFVEPKDKFEGCPVLDILKQSSFKHLANYWTDKLGAVPMRAYDIVNICCDWFN